MVIVISIIVSVLWIRLIKRFETSPRLTGKPSVIMYLFIVGISSTFVALHFYDFEYRVLPHLIYLSPLTYNVLCVGLCEEFGKFIVFYLAVGYTDIMKEPKDGLLQASAVALGFSVLENVLYSGYGMDNLLVRSVLCVAGHMSYAVIWGYAAGLYLFSKRAGRNEYGFSMVIGAVCTSAVFHGLYNYFLAIDLMPVSLGLTAAVIGISVFLLRYLRDRSPYKTADKDLIADAMKSNADNFQLNREAGLQAVKGGRYAEAGKYMRKASEVNRRERSTRVFIVFLELLTGQIEEFEAYRKLDRLCSKLTVYNLHRLKDRTEEVFADCPEKERLGNLLDDLIDEAGQRSVLKRRKAEFDRLAAAGAKKNGFLISDKDSIPMAYRHPEYYKEKLK